MRIDRRELERLREIERMFDSLIRAKNEEIESLKCRIEQLKIIHREELRIFMFNN